jgi:nicotinic acid phosphoribosyltransferase
MARRAIHSLCADRKAKGKDLYEQLKYLKDNNLITPDLWEWAEELRIVGRSGAHPEWGEVSPEDAEYALRFLREIIRYIYINPAERAARRLKEAKKKKS